MRIILLSAFLIITIFECFSASTAHGQNRVRIIQADILEGAGENLRKLSGNVILQTDDFIMMCDTAYHYQQEERLEAFGNIQIETDTDHIWADSLFHNMRTDQSIFHGRVILKNETTTVYSTKANFDHDTDIATFPEFVRLVDEDGTLTSDSGIYFNKADSAIFRGSVQIADSTQYTEADSLFSNRRAGYYELHSNVLLQDFERNVFIHGDYVEADSAGYRRVIGNSMMQRLDDEKQDTTYVWGNILIIQEQDTTYLFDAYDDVHIWTDRYASLSDTARYNDDTELFVLTGEQPKAWFSNMQLTGPRIEIQLEDDQIKSLLSYPRPFAVQEDTVTNRLNQILGDTLYAEFVEGDIHFLRVTQNPEMYYHSKDEDKNPDGAIELKTNQYIIMFFEDGDMTRGKAEAQSDGIFHPENQETAERKLSGFVWNPELKPHKPDVEFVPQHDPIPDEPHISLPQRYLEFISQ